jgi:hypothetical protein
MGILLAIIVIPMFIWLWWMIFTKAGYPGWYGILMIIPLVNLGFLFMLALGDWPVLQTLKKLQAGESLPELPAGNVTQCPQCGSTDIYKAYIEDGGQGDWCPNCKMSLQKMKLSAS